MSKILDIATTKNCGWCPHREEFFDYKSKTDKYRCRKTRRIIHNLMTFPSWCRLEDYKEAKPNNEVD